MHHPVVFSVLLFAAACTSSSSQVESLKPEVFKARMENKVVLLDVRTPDEYNEGHLANAILIDWEATGFDEAVREKIQKDSEILLYCHSGRRSALARTRMKEMGYTRVVHLEGGIKAWQAADLPIEK